MKKYTTNICRYCDKVKKVYRIDNETLDHHPNPFADEMAWNYTCKKCLNRLQKERREKERWINDWDGTPIGAPIHSDEGWDAI